MSSFRPFVSLALLLAACNGSPSGPKGTPACSAHFQPAADRFYAAMSAAASSGGALVIAHQGAIVCEAFWGRYDGESQVPTISAAKWLSAGAILAVVDRGLISLDDPAARHLPYFAGTPGAAATVRQMLAHTSGLSAWAPCLRDPRTTLDACAQQIARNPLIAAPGSQFNYSAAPFSVAGRMAEVVTGDSWAELFADNIATPLGMKGTGYGSTANPILAEGYVHSSAHDYIRFLEMVVDSGVFEGRRILSRDAVIEMARDQTFNAATGFSPRPGVRYGLGAWLDVRRPTGDGEMLTSPGAGGFIPWVDFDARLAGVIVTYGGLDPVWQAGADIRALAREGAGATP